MNAKPYKVSQDFELDFWEIQSWLYEHETPKRSDKIISSILAKMDYINEHPEHFPSTAQNDLSGIPLRKAVHFETFIIIYRNCEDFVEFISIFHGKRNASF